MVNIVEPSSTTNQPPAEKLDNKQKLPYNPPHLEILGDLRTLTLGASGFGGDWSGFNTNERRFPPP